MAWKSDLTNGFADGVQFFAFSGHGIDSSTTLGQSAAHFYTLNSSTNFHAYGDHFNSLANAKWDEIRWGANQQRWATMQTCNFLRNNNSSTNEQKIQNMFNRTSLNDGFWK